MSIPVCEARWYHGAAPSFGMGLLCFLVTSSLFYKEVTCMNHNANRHVGAVTHMSRL